MSRGASKWLAGAALGWKTKTRAEFLCHWTRAKVGKRCATPWASDSLQLPPSWSRLIFAFSLPTLKHSPQLGFQPCLSWAYQADGARHNDVHSLGRMATAPGIRLAGRKKGKQREKGTHSKGWGKGGEREEGMPKLTLAAWVRHVGLDISTEGGGRNPSA